MKVRARVKAREYLPEWAKCCEESIEEGRGAEMIVDTADITISPEGPCGFCGRILPPYRAIRVVGGKYANMANYVVYGLPFLDLDEGPMEAQ